MSLRKSAVAGQFYPNNEKEIVRYINHFNQSLHNVSTKIKINALIVPHAGYIYSGFTANVAYFLAAHQTFKRIVVIGPSHRVFVHNASIARYDEYETPFGNITVDQIYAQQLQEQYSFLTFNDGAHHEHSTETQAPFIKHYFPNAKIVEIVYGQQNPKELSGLVDYCIQDSDNLVVISTDLSHFYTQKEANYLDNICLEAIQDKNIQKLDEGCEACGMIGVKALLHSAIKKDLTVELLHYCTSFERTQDDSSVVGYCSFIIGE